MLLAVTVARFIRACAAAATAVTADTFSLLLIPNQLSDDRRHNAGDNQPYNNGSKVIHQK